MKTKLLAVIVGLIITSTIFLIMNDLRVKEQSESVHNMVLVKNCVPSDPDDPIPAIGPIMNATHKFDLRNCVWIPIK